MNVKEKEVYQDMVTMLTKTLVELNEEKQKKNLAQEMLRQANDRIKILNEQNKRLRKRLERKSDNDNYFTTDDFQWK